MNKIKLLKIFIIIQPILDLITSLQSTYLNLPISLSILFRGLTLLVIGLYLLIYSKNKKIRNYMISIILFFLVFVINIFFIKGSSFILSEIYTFIRYFYFPILLIFFYIINKKIKLSEIFDKKMITYICIFYFSIVLVAFLTSTSFASYLGDDKIGYNGWFYSANERGNTYSILLPLLLIYFIKDYKYLFLIIMGMFAMLIIGTKVGYIGSTLTCLGMLLYLIIKKFTSKEKNGLKILIISLLLTTSVLVIRYLPVYKNIELQSTKVEEIIDDKEKMTEEEIDDIVITDDNYLIEDKNQNLVYSGREVFLKQNIEYYGKQDILSKLFGVGVENKYLDKLEVAPKVEIDVFDIFFTFGIIGFIIYFIPIVYIFLKIIKILIKNIKLLLESSIWFKTMAIGIALLISVFSGHVLLAPSVSIYLILIITSLYYELKKDLK
ncbi:MAG: O-antigen ligase family protein [Bacilli bacterium]|nr:O-antigen ligase family protein [Bacilli bacterium]